MWTNTKKASIAMKQQVAPLQANEVASIRRKTASFDVRQHEFREEFRKMGALLYSCSDPYDLIDEVTSSFHLFCVIFIWHNITNVVGSGILILYLCLIGLLVYLPFSLSLSLLSELKATSTVVSLDSLVTR